MEDKYWFIPDNGARSTVRQNARDSESKKSFRVKFCIICNKAHELCYENNRTELYYHDDFTTYGLDRKICGVCDESS